MTTKERRIVDLDDVDSYPSDIEQWILEYREYFEKTLGERQYSEGWEIGKRLNDMSICDSNYVQEYIVDNPDMEFIVCHATRIENIYSFLQRGIRVINGCNSDTEDEIRALLKRVGFNYEQECQLIEKISRYWKRDKTTRVGMIHFFYPYRNIKDPMIRQFAINLGGECVRWGIEDVDSELFKQEPYKRLYIQGTPCVIKFKCRLKDMERSTQERIIRELIKYYIITDIFGLDYMVEDTGMKRNNVNPEDIVEIVEIGDFIEKQELFDDMKHFYDELK